MTNDQRLERDAFELLRSPRFFACLLDALGRLGLVGEVRNAVVLYIVAISSLLDRPLNAILKGPSSIGKNFAASRVLKLIPESAVIEITSSSKTAWNYGQQSFRNKVIYIQERNDSSGATHPVRLLISEGRLIRTVTVREGGLWVPKTFVAEGPVASISTTTRDRVQVDDETRHLSLWPDDSAIQTQRINRSYVAPREPLTPDEIAVWHRAFALIENMAGAVVKIPNWFTVVANKVDAQSVTSRRYFPAFVEGCRAISLLRSFQNDMATREVPLREVSFEDYAVATILFRKVFVESLHRSANNTLSTRNAVAEISQNKGGSGIDASELAEFLSISEDRGYRLLRKAAAAGAIRRANSPAKANLKLYVAADLPRFLPDPGEVLAEISELTDPVEFLHPLTGKPVEIQRKYVSEKAARKQVKASG